MELQRICIGWYDHDLFLTGTGLPVPAEKEAGSDPELVWML
jgi:hypothetical protein